MQMIKQLWAMRSIALMLLIFAGDVELNPGPTGSSPCSPLLHMTPVVSVRLQPLCNHTSYHQFQSLVQSTTDNYQLLTLKQCIISPVNTPTQVLYIPIEVGGQFFRACPSCKKQVHIRLKICKYYGFALRRLGRSAGTNATAGFDVSSGRPTRTNIAAGFKVSSGGPVGTTAARGSKVGHSPGRPKGTTEAAGSHTSVGGGRPVVLKEGVNKEKVIVTQLITAGKCEQDETWCTDKQMVNVSATKLNKLKKLFSKECKFDSTPLGKTICWKCGRILYSNIGSSCTYLVLPPKGMTEAEAPASAYLHALPYDNGLTFVHIKGKRYSCPTCKRGKIIPTEQHVGDVLLPPPSNAPKLKLPDALYHLSNDYER